MLDADLCYRALLARDRRFDGVFFVGVHTTGIYCRPVCPARTPSASRCAFFANAALAERAGFRACFRCRPEIAPATKNSFPPLVRHAVAAIEGGMLNDHSASQLAKVLGVSPRHLRRVLEAHLGVSPVRYAQTQRLALAKHLLQSSGLGLAEIAFASGFSSVRRFNALFLATFGRPPSTLRRHHAEATPKGEIELRLDYRPPLDFAALLDFLGRRAILGVELIGQGEYWRSVRHGKTTGWIRVTLDERHHGLRVRASASLLPKLMEVVRRVRNLFDLDARPEVISDHLETDLCLRRCLEENPGLRIPGAFDEFEIAIRAILGQQVSVRAATTLSGRLVARFGEPAPEPSPCPMLFPTPEVLAQASVDELCGLGLMASRARSIRELSRAVVEGRLDWSCTDGFDETVARLEALEGIGPWTAHYIAMRALGWPDAFPASDLVIRRRLGGVTAKQALARARAWRPWRAYAAMHLWRSFSNEGK